MFVFDLDMVCENLGKVTPCFFENKNRKKNIFFYTFF